MFISIVTDANEKFVKVLKAPHGLIYEIHEITMNYVLGTSGQVFVLDHGKHEITDFSIANLSAKNCLCGGAFASSIPMVNQWSFHGLVDTKFISIVSALGCDVGVLIVIVAKLKSISRENALLEYLMKTR